MKNPLQKLILILFLPLLLGCDDFLDARPNKDINTPTTLQDLRAMLDNTVVMNISPGLGIAGTDDVYTTEALRLSFSTIPERNAYTWEKDLFENALVGDWNNPYRTILFTNIILESIETIEVPPSSQKGREEIKGQALFFRSLCFFELLQHFAPAYDETTADSQLGIPLKKSPIVDDNEPRSTVKVGYQTVINDLLEALPLLPLEVDYLTRPSQRAGHALLARIYLDMGKYSEAAEMASLAIGPAPLLMDYSELNTTLAFPIPQFNKEVIFHNQAIRYSFVTFASLFIDPDLHNRFEDNDVRKSAFFRDRGNNTYSFKGNYTGNFNPFSGLAMDEMLLIRAESNARLQNYTEALDDVNFLLSSRYMPGTFIPWNREEIGDSEVLKMILNERRKSLMFRYRRWNDLKRLNLDPAFQKTISRNIEGNTIELAPNHINYVFPIPQRELEYNNIPQNPRN